MGQLNRRRVATWVADAGRAVFDGAGAAVLTGVFDVPAVVLLESVYTGEGVVSL